MKAQVERANVKKGTIDHYLELIGDDFYAIHVHSTAGDIRPPYPFQWIAYSKIFDGDDDPYEGFGGTPYEAVQNLYVKLRNRK